MIYLRKGKTVNYDTVTKRGAAFWRRLMFLMGKGSTVMVIDNLLKFRTHDFGILCFGGVTNVNLVYAGSGHNLCVSDPASEKTPADKERVPGFLSGAYHAFAGPVEMDWNARDGTHLSHTVDLNEVFKDKIIPHACDSTRIYEKKPVTCGKPTVIVEMDDRTVNVYLYAEIQLVRDGQPDKAR
jgi:hypothetical protein